MTTDDSGKVATDRRGDPQDLAPEPAQALTKLEQNLARIDALTQRLVAALASPRTVPQSLQGPSPELYAKAGAAIWQEWIDNPGKIIESQMNYWSQTVKHYVEAQHALTKGDFKAPEDPGPKDRRFANPLWESHPYFNYIKRQYLMNAEAVRAAVAATEGLDPRERRRLEYFSRQIIDLLAPTNFLASNPDALERAAETEGESLVQGLENLISDLETHQGDMVVSLADRDAFTVGENLATTPGEVVWRNHLFELIQYTPTTPKVREIPLILFPPWINKFYILDLKPQNSLIKWIVDQGYTLFVVSWVNPDAGYRDTTMTDYVEDGFLAAIREAKSIAGTEQVNAIGYCIAGTTLSLSLAVMAARGDKSVASATFFTTLTDFSDQGEVGVFLDDDFVDGIEAECKQSGILDSYYMSRTFSYLRSNDLIYQPAIRSYMLGQTPPAFDLLYWNGDGTNLPGAMAVEYLRGLCQRDEFATTGFLVAGVKARISDVKVPICAIACETDHIAAWKSSYAGIQKMGSTDKTFILAGSGHIAGIVNPPSRVKYGHWTNPDLALPSQKWRETADAHEGSWWPTWEPWLRKRSGPKVPARAPGDSAHPSLCPAPGRYVISAEK